MKCPHCDKVIVVQVVKDDGKQQGFPPRPENDGGSAGNAAAMAVYLEQINHDSLDGKDYDFVTDMQRRHEQYGQRALVSDKQLAWLKRLATGEKKEKAFRSGSPSSFDDNDVPF